MPILKPDSCRGCPFYSKSKYITPDLLIPDSAITILAQNPGSHEERGERLVRTSYRGGKKSEETEQVIPQPLIGASGNFLRREFWSKTKLNYESVSRCNVIKCRPFNSNELPNIAGNVAVNGISVKELKEAVSYCTRTHLRFPESTKYIVAMGELSLYALTGEELLNYKKSLREEEESDELEKRTEKKSTISEWRGWVLGKEYNGITPSVSCTRGLYDYYDPQVRDLKIFPVMHPAALFRNDAFFHATLLDFERFGKLVRGEWPKPLPEIRINEMPERIPSLIAFDSEYTQEKALTQWSIADVQSNIYVIDAAYSEQFRNLPEDLTIVTQNGAVDLPHLKPLIPTDWKGSLRLEDCMYAHSVLWPGELHSLDYQLSKYGDYNRHKHLRETENQELRYLYAGLDAQTTLNNAWKAHVRHFKRDRLLWNEYCQRKRDLLYIIARFDQRGIRVDQVRVELVAELLDAEMERIQAEARALTGTEDFNIRSSQQVGEFLYEH